MRKILIVVDMQNDFIDGSLGTNEAVGIVPAVIDKIKEYDPKDIFATRDTHEINYLESQEGNYLPVEHCIIGTKGWEISDQIAAFLEGASLINKPTFGSIELAERIWKISQKEEIELELVGLCTDICVISNALLLKAYMPEIKISVDEHCCAGVTPQKHQAAIETMRSCQIQIV